jgi:hypothetical protein
VRETPLQQRHLSCRVCCSLRICCSLIRSKKQCMIST